MKSMLVSVCVAAGALIASDVASAQDVAITNARIIVGSGQVIDSGTIIVRGGKIVSVGAGATPAQGLRVIDAKGMAAMPGFIDGHKHVNNFDAPQMKSLIEAGYTTVLAGGGPAEANIALRDRIEKGEFVGPRIIASGQINLRQTPAEARAAVQALAAKGIKHTGEIGLTPEPAPPQSEIEVLKAIVDEAKKAGIQVNVHAVSSPAMVAAIDAGVTRLVPAASEELPSPALGSEGGGQVPMNPKDLKGQKAMRKVFQMDLQLPLELGIVNVGGRVYVRFDHGWEPLMAQWYRQGRQLFLSRFNV